MSLIKLIKNIENSIKYQSQIIINEKSPIIYLFFFYSASAKYYIKTNYTHHTINH